MRFLQLLTAYHVLTKLYAYGVLPYLLYANSRTIINWRYRREGKTTAHECNGPRFETHRETW